MRTRDKSNLAAELELSAHDLEYVAQQLRYCVHDLRGEKPPYTDVPPANTPPCLSGTLIHWLWDRRDILKAASGPAMVETLRKLWGMHFAVDPPKQRQKTT